jgi:hypothetical protein
VKRALHIFKDCLPVTARAWCCAHCIRSAQDAEKKFDIERKLTFDFAVNKLIQHTLSFDLQVRNKLLPVRKSGDDAICEATDKLRNA